MNRYIIKLTPKDFYYEEMNHKKLFDGDITHFAVPVGDYAVGDLITFDYRFLIETILITRTYKIDEIIPQKEIDFFRLAENGLVAIKAHYHDHTKDSEEIKSATEIIELT